MTGYEGAAAEARRQVDGGITTYVLPLPYSAPPLSLNDRGRSRKAAFAKARKVRELRNATVLVGRLVQMRPAPHLHVVLHYVPRDSRIRDRDNLVATLKPCIDALTARGADRGWACLSLVPDDDPGHVSWAPPVIHPPDDGGPRLWLVVTALPSAPSMSFDVDPAASTQPHREDSQ